MPVFVTGRWYYDTGQSSEDGIFLIAEYSRLSMRIAVWHDPPMGGAQRALSEMLRRLPEHGHAVDIYRLGRVGDDATSENAYGLPARVIPFQPRRHQRLAFYWNDFLSYRDFCDEEQLEADLARSLDNAEYDVVLCSVLRWGIAPSLLRFCRTPSVYYCHEPPRRFYEPWCRPDAAPLSLFERSRLLWRWPSQQLLDRWVQAHDRSNVQSASLVLSNSRYTQQTVQKVYGLAAEVCYLGVDCTRFYPGTAVKRGVGVVTVGALEAHKGFDFLIEALALLPQDIRPPLTIVGSGGHPNMPAHLGRMAAEHGVSLIVRRGLSDTELIHLYQSSAAFVFGARMEPFGLVLLEAMACALPVVAVGEGGVPEAVIDDVTGYLTPRSPQIFADRLKEVLCSTDLRESLGNAARRNVEERWRWESAVSVLEAQLTRIAGLTDVAKPGSV